MLRSLCLAGFFATGLLLLGSFLGALHPLGDSLAVFRLQILVAFAICAGATLIWDRRKGSAGLCLALAASLPFIDPLGRVKTAYYDQHLSIYQKNLNFGMRDTEPVLADIRALKPDVVTLQEVSARLEPILQQLKDDYPHQALCPFYKVIGGVAVVSRHQILETRCADGLGMVATQVDISGDRIWVVSIHLHWPFPHRQSDQVAKLLPELAALDGAVVVGGDFNMVPWSSTLRRIRRATRSLRSRGPITTLPRFGRLIPLPIDHVLSPGGGVVRKRPQLGSDHIGLFAIVDAKPD